MRYAIKILRQELKELKISRKVCGWCTNLWGGNICHKYGDKKLDTIRNIVGLRLVQCKQRGDRTYDTRIKELQEAIDELRLKTTKAKT